MLRPPRRIAVAGTSGVGKTTLAARIAARLDVPHTEIDALHHGPGWVPREQFLDDVCALIAQDAWVMEWQYTEARPLIAERAELLVWLDLPVPQQMARLVRRTLARRWHRKELWNGNTEPPLRTFLTGRDHVIRWGWRTRHRLREQVPAALAAHPQLRLVHLGSQRAVERWLAEL
ncbi:AAA family ATPase [Aeromicrobium phragmitis]|uniref:AAA family ATPase n=1 Tax=Aeromicrobium phragmitis TaxID=2478914 RepID=A0A3L8PRB4_9ACTN|nr:AAA family ATPase [Aeromicrobium phragmitis]RLV57173.1 AAA family ATPase [Aeromicrobium phragmitis]